MFSHIIVGSQDIVRSARFYDAVLAPIGLVQREVVEDGSPEVACWASPGTKRPRFYVALPLDEKDASAGNGSMTAFLAPSRAAVDAAFAAGLAHGGRSEGDPGPRPHYGPDYYGAYMRDPDNNKIHFVHNPEDDED